MHNPSLSQKTLFFVLLLLFYSYFFQTPSNFNNPNEYSRLYLTMAIVDDHTTAIDGPIARYGLIQDRSMYKGRYYTSKAPGLSLLAVPVYVILKSATQMAGLKFSEKDYLYYLRLFCISLPSALLCFAVYCIWRKIPGVNGMSGLIALGFGLGSISYPYATLFYGHQLSAVLAYLSFGILFLNRTNLLSSRIFLAGFFSGYAALTEFTTGFILVCIFVYLLSLLKEKKSAIFFMYGAALPFLFLLIYNYASFGSPFEIGYQHESEQEFIDVMSKGFMGITVPSLYSIYGTLFSPYRGLFFYSPFLILCFPALWFLWQNKNYRMEFFLITTLFLGFLYIAAGYSLWDGGWSVGPRHIVPILPFLTTTILFLPEDRIWKTVVPALLWLSIAEAVCYTAVFPYYPHWFENPIMEVVFPLLSVGKMGDNLGFLLGLEGVKALSPLFLLIFLAQYTLFQKERKRNALCLAVAFLVLLSVAFFGSEPNTKELYKVAMYL